MLNKLWEFACRYSMFHSGEDVVCAVSGGADSMALLFAMYLLKEKAGIRLSAAHFNHGLRGEESDRDEAFVRDFCDRYEIPLFCGRGEVKPGKKGLEAAARDARYEFLKELPGKIATAHTADDNAETVLMHLVRGTGLKGLGGIMPVNGSLVRPMLSVTRAEVIAFLQEYHIGFVTDSSNETDDFLRNRLRHSVMPVLKEENPRLAEKLSAMALRLREDEEDLQNRALQTMTGDVVALRKMSAPVRSRVLSRQLEMWGVKEPEAEHIALAESLVFSGKPSAKANFPGGVTVCRNYDQLEVVREQPEPEAAELEIPGVTEFCGLQIYCIPAEQGLGEKDRFVVELNGKPVVRSRRPGDNIRLSGGTKSLKKLFIDKKIPARLRQQIPVIADDGGVLGVYGIGPNLDRLSEKGVQICFEGQIREKEK